MDLIDELRGETRVIHQRIEGLPIARAMVEGKIDHAAYVELLGRLLSVHSTFEREIALHPELLTVWPAQARRADAIARDLQALGATVCVDLPILVAAWRDRLRDRASDSPSVWGGAGYVLEGSRMGGRMLLGPIARGLGLPMESGVGLDYHREGLADLAERWRGVMVSLATLDNSPAARSSLVFGAVATFELLFDLHDR